jgi:hypothetical protein
MDVTSEPEIEQPKPRLRWLRWVGFCFLALAVVFGILAFLPSSPSFEPAWLAKIPPTSSEVNFYEKAPYPPTVAGALNDIQSSEKTRFVKMPFDALVKKLNQDLRSEDGWRFDRPLTQDPTVSWNLQHGTGTSTIWAVQEDAGIRVVSMDVHIMTWFDKFKRFLHRVFRR